METGPEVTDHIQLRNPTIRLKGTISNTPLDLSVSIANLAAGTYAAITSSQARSNLLNSAVSQGVGMVGSALQGKAGNIAANAFAGAVDAITRTILINAFESKTPFTVFNKRQTFNSVVIRKLSFPRNEGTGYALDFKMDIKQIRVVSTTKVQKNNVSEDVISGAASITNLGSQSTILASNQMTSAIAATPRGFA